MSIENEFQLGDHIRAYDFEPLPGRTDRYIEGEIVNCIDGGWQVRVDVDTCWPDPELKRHMVIVPHHLLISDWVGRVTKIADGPCDCHDDHVCMECQIGMAEFEEYR